MARNKIERRYRWFDISWHEYAACRGVGDESPGGVWFAIPLGIKANPAVRPEIQKALRYCGRCPVRLLCWLQAAEDPDAEGVWGGQYWPTGLAMRRQIIERGPELP